MLPKASVPKHVKERAAEADKKLEALAKEKSGTPSGTPSEPAAPATAPAPPAPTPPAPESPIPAPAVAAPVVVPPPPAPVGSEPPAPTGSIIPEATPVPASEKEPGPKPGETPEETIRRMGKALLILQGKYNAEVPGLMRENHQLKEEVAQLKPLKDENERLKTAATQFEQRIAEAEAKAANAKATQGSDVTTTPTVTKFDEEMADHLGIKPEDFAALRIGIIASIPKPSQPAQPAAPASSSPSAPPAEPADPKGSAKPASSIAPEKAAYLETLDALIGGKAQRLAAFNDPMFLQFLNTDLAIGVVLKDKTTGRNIGDIAYDAEQANDAILMSEIYRSFYAWKSGGGATVMNDKPKNLMPASKGGTADLTTDKKPIYSQAQVDAFQQRVRRHEFSGIGKTAEEAKKLAEEYKLWSDEFASARAEGRIRG